MDVDGIETIRSKFWSPLIGKKSVQIEIVCPAKRSIYEVGCHRLPDRIEMAKYKTGVIVVDYRGRLRAPVEEGAAGILLRQGIAHSTQSHVAQFAVFGNRTESGEEGRSEKI